MWERYQQRRQREEGEQGEAAQRQRGARGRDERRGREAARRRHRSRSRSRSRSRHKRQSRRSSRSSSRSPSAAQRSRSASGGEDRQLQQPSPNSSAEGAAPAPAGHSSGHAEEGGHVSDDAIAAMVASKRSRCVAPPRLLPVGQQQTGASGGQPALALRPGEWAALRGDSIPPSTNLYSCCVICLCARLPACLPPAGAGAGWGLAWMCRGPTCPLVRLLSWPMMTQSWCGGSSWDQLARSGCRGRSRSRRSGS